MDLRSISGILNFVLKSGHVIQQNISWLGDKNWALMAIIVILLTTSVGQPIILYIAAMGNIDNSLVEAARVDGATELQVSGRSNGQAYCQQLCTLRSLRPLTLSNVSP